MLFILSLIVVSIVLGYFSAPLWIWFAALAGFLLLCKASILWWIITIALAFVLLNKEIRIKVITKPLFAFLKKKGLLPKISETEKDSTQSRGCVG